VYPPFGRNNSSLSARWSARLVDRAEHIRLAHRSIFIRAALPSNQRNSLLRAKKERGAAIHFHFRPQLSTPAARSTEEASSSSPVPGNATEDKREKRENVAKGVIVLSCAARRSDMRAHVNGNILSIALISEISESPRLLLRSRRLNYSGLDSRSVTPFCTLLPFSRSLGTNICSPPRKSNDNSALVRANVA
jgi:hypothetical protein